MDNFEIKQYDSEQELENHRQQIKEYGIESFINGWTNDEVGSAIMEYIEDLESKIEDKQKG